MKMTEEELEFYKNMKTPEYVISEDYPDSDCRNPESWGIQINDPEKAQFIGSFPPEEQPLDDDMPDFMDQHHDKFKLFCEEL